MCFLRPITLKPVDGIYWTKNGAVLLVLTIGPMVLLKVLVSIDP
jgi:hypothetical protein